MKLVVMIPAYDEQENIAEVIKSIPRTYKGIDQVEILVIDDGSDDETSQRAEAAGADAVIRHKMNLGLAYAFATGLRKALEMGADIIVNTDADNQYDQNEIQGLIDPILQGEADIVNTDRQVKTLEHMPFGNKYGNILGTWVVNRLISQDIKDASSGFRAYSRYAAENLHVLSNHTYTHETLIQADMKHIKIVTLPCTFRQTKRKSKKSRLIGSIFGHIKKSGSTIVRTYVVYRPLKTFFYLAILFFTPGFILGLRYLYFYLQGTSGGHIQSLILASMLMSMGVQIALIGLVADTISALRKIVENKKL
ncbi:MAG TPA: glycosyltransferase family 2 protein [bacterium]|nr:glycosyltransferase family 2 protein [bacterium]